RFTEIAAEERAHEARSTFFVMAGYGHRADGAAPEAYDRLRPQLVETLLGAGSEIGLHGSYLAADDLERLARERPLLAQLDGRRSTVAASRSCGTRSASTGPARAAGTGSISSWWTPCANAAGSV